MGRSGGQHGAGGTAGFRVVVLSSVWQRPRTAPTTPELAALRRAIEAAEPDGIQPIVAVYSFASDTPLTQRDRAQFTAYAASILRAFPQLRTISIGNEPNSSDFWRPQFGPHGSDAAATAYFKLLRFADRTLKQVDPQVSVIGGSLAAAVATGPGPCDPPLADEVHRRSRGRVSSERPLEDPIRPLLAPPLPCQLVGPSDGCRSRFELARDRRLPGLVALLREAFGGRPRSSTASTGSRR